MCFSISLSRLLMCKARHSLPVSYLSIGCQGTEVSANTQQLSEMLEGQGQRAMDGVKGWLREEKASDWLVRTSSTHC